MAFASDSTTAPARPLLPLVFRPSAPVDDPRSADELLAEIATEIERQLGVPKFGDTPELPPEPLLPADVPHGVAGVLKSEETVEPDAVTNYPDHIGAVADAARTLHLRRQLAQAAEHGVALLVALDLPRLVTPDFLPLDREVIGSAIDNAINLLDALDGDTDREDEGEAEPSLGWTAHVNQTTFNVGGSTDAELDTSDGEPSLASPERHPAVPAFDFGIPYTARGGDESQLRWAEGARDDREKVDEDGPIDDDELDGAGDDPGAEPWWSFERSAVSEGAHHV